MKKWLLIGGGSGCGRYRRAFLSLLVTGFTDKNGGRPTRYWARQRSNSPLLPVASKRRKARWVELKNLYGLGLALNLLPRLCHSWMKNLRRGVSLGQALPLPG
jgi:hypothetical protein